MPWPDWLVLDRWLPRMRQAPTETTLKLSDMKRGLDVARERIDALEARLAVQKRHVRRLKRRLAAAKGAADHDRLLVFDHIPKTAGSTFRRSYLVAALPPDERWILGGGATNARDQDRFLALSPARRARLRIVAGHNGEALRPHLPRARFISVVRDPVDRAVSSYLHARFHAPEPQLVPDFGARELSLGQFVERHVTPNTQSRIVLGEDYACLDETEIRHRLRSRYVLVGYTEALDQFVYLLHVTEGLPLCLYENRLVRAERQSFAAAEGDLEIVRRTHDVDAVLHRVVKEEFQSRIDAMTDVDRDRLRRFLESLRVFRDGVQE